MATPTRSHSLIDVALQFTADASPEDCQKSLIEMQHLERPNNDTIAAVIPLLNQPDDAMRTLAEQLLASWGQQAVTMLMKELRSTQPTDVPYRLAILAQLGRMGPGALRAETLLRSLMEDPDIGDAAGRALREIRRDGDDLVGRFLHWGVELALLACVVAAPMIAIRFVARNMPMPPVGLSVGVACLVILGLMLARVTYASDLLPAQEERSLSRPGRWSVYLVTTLGGLLAGFTLAGVSVAFGGACQQMFK